MPIYAYRCENCGFAKDVLQKISDPLLTVCPSCGHDSFRKQVTAAGFQLKGSGWYVTDFRDKPATTTPPVRGESDGKGSDRTGEKSGEKNAESRGEKSAEGKSDTSGKADSASAAPSSSSASSSSDAKAAPSPAPSAPAKSDKPSSTS